MNCAVIVYAVASVPLLRIGLLLVVIREGKHRTASALPNYHASVPNPVSSLAFPRHSERSKESGGDGGGALIGPRPCSWVPQHPARTLRRNTCRGEIYRAQDPPPPLHCKLKVSLASNAPVLKPGRVTQRLSDTNTSGAINRAPTPEGFVRLLSIASILSIRGKHLRPLVPNPVSSLAFPRHSERSEESRGCGGGALNCSKVISEP